MRPPARRSTAHLALASALLLACGPGAGTDTDTDPSAGDPDTGSAPAECPESIEPIATPAEYAEALARAVCAKAEACGCGSIPERCLESKIDDYTQRNDTILAAGGIFQPECARLQVLRREWSSCDSFYAEGSEVETDPQFPCEDCRDFVGALPEGAACEYPSYYGNHLCAPGLICNSGTCTKDVPTVGLGEPCAEGYDPTMRVGRCEEGALCDYLGGSCVAAPAAGDPCVTELCGLDLYCDHDGSQEGVCRPRLAAGEACEVESGHLCHSFSCEAGACSSDPRFCLEL